MLRDHTFRWAVATSAILALVSGNSGYAHDHYRLYVPVTPSGYGYAPVNVVPAGYRVVGYIPVASAPVYTGQVGSSPVVASAPPMYYTMPVASAPASGSAPAAGSAPASGSAPSTVTINGVTYYVLGGTVATGTAPATNSGNSPATGKAPSLPDAGSGVRLKTDDRKSLFDTLVDSNNSLSQLPPADRLARLTSQAKELYAAKLKTAGLGADLNEDEVKDVNNLALAAFSGQSLPNPVPSPPSDKNPQQQTSGGWVILQSQTSGSAPVYFQQQQPVYLVPAHAHFGKIWLKK